MSVHEVSKSNEAPNQVTGPAASAVDKKTNGIANRIITRLNLTESSPMRQSVTVGAVIGACFLGVGAIFGALIGLIHGIVSAIKLRIALSKIAPAAFDTLKSHVESTLGNNPILAPKDAKALFSQIDEFKKEHGSKFEAEIKLLETSIKGVIQKQMKEEFQAIKARVEDIDNHPEHYTVTEALTAHSDLLNFNTKYNDFISKDSRKKVNELRAKIKLVIVETFSKKLTEAFDAIKSKVNFFVRTYDEILSGDPTQTVEKLKAEVNKFRKIIIDTQVQPLIDSLESIGNKHLYTALNELSTRTKDDELTIEQLLQLIE